MKRSGDKYKDINGYSHIYCKLTKELCIAQRFCPEQDKYIISERAKNICKNYR
jgi:hypothetical protein